MTCHSEADQLQELLVACGQARANAERRVLFLEKSYDRMMRINAMLSERIMVLQEQLDSLSQEPFSVKEGGT